MDLVDELIVVLHHFTEAGVIVLFHWEFIGFCFVLVLFFSLYFEIGEAAAFEHPWDSLVEEMLDVEAARNMLVELLTWELSILLCRFLKLLEADC